jgi:diguanylate cyclase (GGDEF)-like protein
VNRRGSSRPGRAGPAARSGTHRAAVLGAAAAGLVLVVVALAAPWDGVAQGSRVALACGAALAIGTGIRLHRPARQAPWWILAGGFALFGAGHLAAVPGVWSPPLLLGELAPLAAYPVLGLAVLGLLRAQRPSGDREAAIDAAVVVIALATFLGGNLVSGSAQAGPGWTASAVGTLTLGAITAGTVRLLFSDSSRSPSTWLLVGASASGLVGSVLRTVELTSAVTVVSWHDGFVLAAYVLVGLAGLHPTMSNLTDADGDSRAAGGRLAILGLSLMAAPVTLLVQQPDRGIAVIVGGSVVLSLLVLWRLGRLVAERDLVRAQQHARADRQTALAEIGLYALREHDRQKVVEETLRISTALLHLQGCQIRTAATPVAVAPDEVEVPMISGDQHAGRLAARRTQPLSAEDRAFLQSVANVLAGVVQREQAQNEMRRRAVHDPLTGLPNRILLLDRLEHALTRAQRNPAPVGVMFIDLDGFKRVNDDLGHRAGDELLRAVAERLRKVLRRQDTLARLSGDEFVVLCEKLSMSDATLIAERIVQAMHRAFRLPGGEARVTASVGVALSDAHGGDPGQLLYQADAAMYHAKDSGGAAYEVFDEKLGARLHRRRWLEQQLRGASARGELSPVYQPLIQLDRDLGEIGLFGVETLLRWTHPTAGPISPGEFIPVADATGLIVQVGEWILREACRQLVEWRRELPDDAPFSVFVNISPRQLTDPDFPARVQAVLDESGADARHLVLEVTETAILDDQGEGARTLKALRRLGLRIALDDFGTGYSSLTHLKRLPLDLIKVDASFVDGVGGTGEDRAIVAAVIGIARELGVAVVGEGVETEEQLSALIELGCDIAQGYHLGRPLPVDRVRPYLSRWERSLIRADF